MTTPLSPSALDLPIAALYERARSLDAEQEDIDALLLAMDRPVWPGQKVRPHAYVLHRILEDPVLGGLRGSDKRRVDEVAVHALVALGEPYASELSAEGRKILQNAPPPRAPAQQEEEAEAALGESHTPSTGNRLMGVIAFVCGLGETLALVMALSGSQGSLRLLLLGVIGSAITLMIPGAQLSNNGRVQLMPLILVLNFLAIPAMGFLGFISLFFLGSNVMNQLVGFISMTMAAGAGARIVLMIYLLVKEAREQL